MCLPFLLYAWVILALLALLLPENRLISRDVRFESRKLILGKFRKLSAELPCRSVWLSSERLKPSISLPSPCFRAGNSKDSFCRSRTTSMWASKFRGIWAMVARTFYTRSVSLFEWGAFSVSKSIYLLRAWACKLSIVSSIFVGRSSSTFLSLLGLVNLLSIFTYSGFYSFKSLPIIFSVPSRYTLKVWLELGFRRSL